ncbi:MAG: hypothetical protein U0V02_00560 [Anaerolineales bacterium]
MNKRIILSIILLIILTSCQAATPPPPITASINDEFILASGQSATINGTDLTLHLITVSNDQRCPSGIECAISRPVSLSISIQKGDNEPTEFFLQTFTDNDGRAPEGPFEGIQDRVEYEGYIFRIKAVAPYPVNRTDTIKDSEYRVSFTVLSK